MRRSCFGSLLVAAFLAPLALAQPTHRFAGLAALTNTRYETVGAPATLASNGSEFFLFWGTAGRVRMSRLVDGDALVGRSVLPRDQRPSAVWRGDRFLVVSWNATRAIDPNGTPLGEVSSITGASEARIATNGRTTIMVAAIQGAVRAYIVDNFGSATDAGVEIGWGDRGFSISPSGERFVIAKSSYPGHLEIVTISEQRVIQSRQNVAGVSGARHPILASDGRNVLAVWAEATSLKGCTIDANGTIGPPFTIASVPAGKRITPGAAVWAGDRFAVGYSSGPDSGGFERADLVYNVGSLVFGATTLAAPSNQLPSLAYAGGKLVASYESNGSTIVRDLTGPDTSVHGAWAAKRQYVAAAVSSANATLVLWRERSDGQWYLGLRGHDGSWRERALAGGDFNFAATNGEEFVVVSRNANGTQAFATRLSAAGLPLGAPTSIPFYPEDAVWNGAAWVIAGRNNVSRIVAATLSDGTLSPAAVFGDVPGGETRIASDGTNTLLVWKAPVCFFHCSSYSPMKGTLLSPDLQELTPHGFDILPSGFGPVEVEWDGRQYVVVFSQSDIRTTRVSRDGVPDRSILVITDAASAWTFTTAPLEKGIGIVWQDMRSETLTTQVRLLDRNGNVSTVDASAFTGSSSESSPRLVALPGNRVGYLGTHYRDPEPHFGSLRLSLAIADVTAPQLPDPPRASLTLETDNTLRLEWTAPPQPVNGYRVEYKIGEEAWLEFEGWYPPAQRTATITLSRRRYVPYRFRVRAWNDAGVSAYSEPVTISFAKRRSVR